MGNRRHPLDSVGPFGNPDGSRADIEDLVSDFVDFGGNPAYGHLATRANDSKRLTGSVHDRHQPRS